MRGARFRVSALAVALIGSTLSAQAKDWWQPNYQTGQCTTGVTPDQAFRVLLSSGYPNATMSEVSPGFVSIYLNGTSGNGVWYFLDPRSCKDAVIANNKMYN